MDARSPRRILILRATAILLVVISSMLWPGCSSDPQERYKILSFFFDGVPNPADQVAGGGFVRRLPGGEPMVIFSHKPFAEDKCDACHAGGVNALFRQIPETVSANVCLRCHQDAPSKYPVMHGPVATVECLWCHAPHEANHRWLLRDSAPGVCLQCHTPELLSPNPPEHTMPKSDCLECHYGHGAEQHGLLKPRTAPAGTTAPVGGSP
jgi:predicted CXXCH cytochrome family protein